MTVTQPPRSEMYFDEFKHQLPDIDPAETQEWLDSFDQLVEQEGEGRARFLVYKLLKRARQLHVGLPPLTQTRYINTISPEQEPFFPGDEEIERQPSFLEPAHVHREVAIGPAGAAYGASQRLAAMLSGAMSFALNGATPFRDVTCSASTVPSS